jgi:3-oxoacyl-[acyl-carrier protein] reductase
VNNFVSSQEEVQPVLPHEPTVLSRSIACFADFDTIRQGDEVHWHKTISANDVDDFAKLTGDTNPLHMDDDFAFRTQFHRRVVHGMLLASYVSSLVGMQCPGPGALWSQQNFRWKLPVFIGDRIQLSLCVTHKSTGSRTLTIGVKAMNQDGKVVMEGEGVVSVLEERPRFKDIPVTERVAFVTGTSGGTGAAIASMLANAGVSIMVNYCDAPAEAEDLCTAIKSKGGRAIPVAVDVGNYASVVAGVRLARETFGHAVDLLINNSDSFPETRPFVQTSWEDFQTVLDFHVRGAFNCCQAVIPGMCEQKSGRIINIGSTFARNTPPANWSSFVVAKSALQGFTRSLATELGPHGIRVNMVSPGLVETEAVAGFSGRMHKLQAMQTPLRRLASPDNVAAVVLALCGEAGVFMTGTDIPVCGGFQM